MSAAQRPDTPLTAAYAEALPILAAHIDNSHLQVEAAITALSALFTSIVARLDDALAVSAGMGLEDEGNMSATLTRGKSRLRDVVVNLMQINAGRNALTEEIRGLAACTSELRTMAEEVGQIAFKTNILSLNATIEATHAGEAGKGFAVVAQEVRALSQASRDTGRRINQCIEGINAKLAALGQRSEVALSAEAQAVDACETHINEVLAQFGVASMGLSETADKLRRESATIKQELQGSMVHLQFQDRVSQILSHAAQSLRQLGEQARHPDALDSRQVENLLTDIAATYTTAEQRRTHHGESAVADTGESVTFF